MVSVRFASVIFLAAFLASSVQGATVNSKPYSPDLYARDVLMAESDATPSIGLMKRVNAEKPYAPNLFSRQSLESEDDQMVQQRRSTVVKRSISPAAKATWSLFKRAAEESEEELHSRGLADEAEIEARGQCDHDYECGSHHYCSTVRHKCYRKLRDYHRCDRDGACGSGYCCESEHVCKHKRDDGDRCHGNDGACRSGYCSVVSDKCRQPARKGDSCRVDQGCRGDLSCVNGRCKQTGSSKPSKPHHPSHPAPSGSPRDRRALKSL